MFNFQYSQIKQNKFDKLAELLYNIEQFMQNPNSMLEKVVHHYFYILKPDAVFRKQRASKVPLHLQDKVNTLLDILEQYEIISPVN